MSGRVRGPGRSPERRDEPTRRWWAAADLGVLAGLVVLGAVLLMPAYGSVAPVLATALGSAVALLVIGAVRRWSLPAVAAPLLAAGGVLAMGAAVVEPGGLASPVQIATAAIGGWRDMLTVGTPIGISGGLLMPPMIIGAVATLVAGTLATRRRSELALAGPALALTLSAAFGDVRLDAVTTVLVAAVGLTTTVAWLAWRDVRAARARAGTMYGSRSVAVRQLVVGGVVLAIAVAGGAVVSATESPDRLALRAAVDPPVDPGAFTSPLAEFRRYAKDKAGDPLFVVTGLPAGARLRLAALDSYDGVQFAVTADGGPFVRIGPRRDPALTGPASTVEVRVEDYRGAYLPVPGELVEVSFQGPRATELTDALRYSGVAATGLVPGGLRPGDGYRVTAVPVGPTDSAASAAAAAALPTAQPFPATVPLPDLVRAAANRYVTGVDGAAAQVEAIRAGLAADGYFSHGTPGEPRSAAGHGLNRMSLMLTGTPMIGDQEQYAALFALLVRSIGLPARAVVGFAPAGPRAPDGAVTIRGADVTAWVEVPFEGLGWVAFDATPAPDKPPVEATPPAASERRPVGVEVPPALPQPDPEPLAAENAAQQPEESEDDGDSAPVGPSGLAFALWIVAGLLGALLLVALPVLAILGLKAARRRRRRRAATIAQQITGGWQELLDTAIDAGYRPARGQTRAEVAAAADAALHLELADLTPAADAAEFGGPAGVDETDETVAYRYWERVEDRAAVVLAGLRPVPRWRTRLSLASLRGVRKSEQT